MKSEIYNILAALAGNQPTEAIEKFHNELDARIKERTVDYVKNIDYTQPIEQPEIDNSIEAAQAGVDAAKAAEMAAWEAAQNTQGEGSQNGITVEA